MPEQAVDSHDRRQLSLGKKVLFAAVTVGEFFLILEALFRLAGVGRPPVVGTLRFGYESGIPKYDSDGIEDEGYPFRDYPLFESDPFLFWKPIANTQFTGRDGLRNPVPAQIPKPQGVYRVAVLGDSCSFLGRKLYSERFAELAEQESGVPVEIVNASCPGYTSFQGVRRLETVWPWKPDLLVVYFGWNDHWNSLTGYTDKELAAQRVFEPAHSILQHLHIYRAAQAFLARQPAVRTDTLSRTVRVPLPDYFENLRAMAGQSERHNCQIVFVTAPTAFVKQRLPEWIYPFFAQYYEMSENEIRALPDTHRQYNDAVRQVASNTSGLLLDLAEEWTTENSAGNFRQDCIHLSEQGHADMAKALFRLCPPVSSNKLKPPRAPLVSPHCGASEQEGAPSSRVSGSHAGERRYPLWPCCAPCRG